MAFDTFISYSHVDKTAADAVCAGLEAAGIRCWIAPRDIPAGKEWGEGIILGLEQCRIMVLIFSANANGSPQVRREVERAVSKERPVLPFRIEDTLPDSRLEYFLGNVHWLDALTPPVTDHVERLVHAVRSLLAVEPLGSGETRIPTAPRFLQPKLWTRRETWLAGGIAAALLALAGIGGWWFLNAPERAQIVQDRQVTALAATIRNEINDGAWSDANATFTTLERLAPASGHTFYFEGELQRVMKPSRNLYGAIDSYVRYIDDPRNQATLASPRLDAAACYETAAGFCRQRGAWIMHLLANIFFKMSQDQNTPPGRRVEYLREAGNYVHRSAQLYPPGFRATTAPQGQLVDNAWGTSMLASLIEKSLQTR